MAIIAGGVQPIVFVILLASIAFTYGTAQLLRNPPMIAAGKARAELERPVAQWIYILFAIGVAAAAVFGLGPLLLGGQFGVIVGAAGNDSFVYRQAGAATLGAAVGGYLVLRSRRWSAARLPALMAVTFNGLSVIAAIIEIANGAQPVAYLILAAAVVHDGRDGAGALPEGSLGATKGHGGPLLDWPLRRGVAQPGSAPVWGTGGRGFKSRRPDQFPLRIGPDTRSARPFWASSDAAKRVACARHPLWSGWVRHIDALIHRD